MKCTEHGKPVCTKTHIYFLDGTVWCEYHQLDVDHDIYGVSRSKEVKDADTEHQNKD